MFVCTLFNRNRDANEQLGNVPVLGLLGNQT